MSLEIRQCSPNELDSVGERLDQEFVFNKQRSLSLKKRFPSTLSIDNIEQIRLAVLDGTICGALAIRLFDWIVEDRIWRGAMVGMVWVDVQHRRKGIAGSLLSSATQYLRENNLDFGVLWTGTPKVYERTGWFLNDSSLFGELGNTPSHVCVDNVSCIPLVSINYAQLDHLSSRLLPKRVKRHSIDYQAIPIPANRVMCFSVKNNHGVEGFALVGEQDDNGYFYEMVAPEVLWNIIWAAVTQQYKRLYVNGHAGDPFSLWLAQTGFVTWRRQCKTMWLCLSARMKPALTDNWHIPYFDWI